ELFVVAGQDLAQLWLRAGQSFGIGDRIPGPGGLYFTVIGLLAPATLNPLIPVDLNKALLMSVPAFERIAPDTGLTGAIVRAAPEADPRQVARAAEAELRRGMPGRSVQARSAEQIIAQMAGQMRLYTL